MEKNAPTQQDRWPSVNAKVCQFEPCGKKNENDGGGEDCGVKMAEDGQEINLTWKAEMLKNLVKCRNMAMKRQEEIKKRNIKFSFMKIRQKKWQKLYPNSTHSAKKLQIRLWHHENKEKAEE